MPWEDLSIQGSFPWYQHGSLAFHKYGQGKDGGAMTDLTNITDKELEISLSTKHSIPQDTLKIMESILRKHVDNVNVVFVLSIACSQNYGRLYQ